MSKTKFKAKSSKATSTSKSPKTAPKASASVSTPIALPLDPVNYRTEETTLPIELLCPGPNYATRPLDDPATVELADSIRVHGIQTRLWVRPLEKIVSHATHEIIAGERRYQAARLCGLLEVPVKIFHVDADQARILNLIENLQRKDATAIDEAFAFRGLIESGLDVPAIQARTGKSRTYIYAALKLCDLPAAGRDAVRAGALSPSVAVRIARIPNPAAQTEALASAIEDQWTDARAADLIARRYMQELKGAPFDSKDATLLPNRGCCQKCPLRTGNQREMFPDFATGRGDICTDPDCYRQKVEISTERRCQAHELAGGKVLSEAEAKKAGCHEHYTSIGGSWIDLRGKRYDGPFAGGKTPAELIAEEIKSDPTLITLSRTRDGSGRILELIDSDSLNSILHARGLITEDDHDDDSQTSSAAAAKRKAAAAAKRRDMALVDHQLQVLHDAARETATAGSFITEMCSWLIHELGPDALRPVVRVRKLDTKNFRLEGESYNNTPRELMRRALLAELVDMRLRLEEKFGLLAQLMAVPGFPKAEGHLRENLTGLFNLCEVNQEGLYRHACETIPGGKALLERRDFLQSLTTRIETFLQRSQLGKVRFVGLAVALGVREQDLRDWSDHYSDDESPEATMSASWNAVWLKTHSDAPLPADPAAPSDDDEEMDHEEHEEHEEDDDDSDESSSC